MQLVFLHLCVDRSRQCLRSRKRLKDLLVKKIDTSRYQLCVICMCRHFHVFMQPRHAKLYVLNNAWPLHYGDMTEMSGSYRNKPILFLNVCLQVYPMCSTVKTTGLKTFTCAEKLNQDWDTHTQAILTGHYIMVPCHSSRIQDHRPSIWSKTINCMTLYDCWRDMYMHCRSLQRQYINFPIWQSLQDVVRGFES